MSCYKDNELISAKHLEWCLAYSKYYKQCLLKKNALFFHYLLFYLFYAEFFIIKDNHIRLIWNLTHAQI